MHGMVVLSHGLQSGPDATKVSVLAQVASDCGWRSVRPDYRDIDNRGDVRAIEQRIALTLEQTPITGRVVFAGSSRGAFVSGFASQQRVCEALFLMALPITIPGYASCFEAAKVSTTLVHGWHDVLCPVTDVITFAQARGDSLYLVNDDHRLSNHITECAEVFRQLLQRIPQIN